MPQEDISTNSATPLTKSVTKPPEDIIKLAVDGDGAAPLVSRRGHAHKGTAAGDAPRGDAASSSSKPAGAGEGAGDERRRKPKPLPHKMGPALQKFSRPGVQGRMKPEESALRTKKLGAQLRTRARKDQEAVFRLVKNEVLQTEDVGYLECGTGFGERTSKYSQAEIAKAAGAKAARSVFNFDLPYGPFTCSFSSNGQHLLTGGRKGQIALMHLETMKVVAELQTKETCRAVQVLHNHTMFAAAQKKYVYIYDQQGIELHCLKDHKYPSHLDFLPYHFLLVAAGEQADLHYRDISTGQEVATHRTKLGPTRSMRQNSRTGVMCLGHSNGTVTMWTPTMKEPAVKLFCHPGHVTSLAVNGNYMITCGADALWKVWDLRKYESFHAYRSYGSAVTDVDISMTGLVSVGFGGHVEIWKDVFRAAWQRHPYMKEDYRGRLVSSCRFRPYEDALVVGTSGGFGSILVPGAGYANFDSMEANPFETKKQRREKEVKQLLDKLQPDSIMLDPNMIGNVNKAVADKYNAELEQQKKEEEAAKKKTKKKMRGKNKVGKREKRKKLQQGKSQRERTSARLGENGDGDGSESEGDGSEEDDGSEGADAGAGGNSAAVSGALGRFYGKRRRKT